MLCAQVCARIEYIAMAWSELLASVNTEETARLSEYIRPVSDCRQLDIMVPGPGDHREFLVLWNRWRFRAAAALNGEGVLFSDRPPVYALDVVELVLIPLLQLATVQHAKGDGSTWVLDLPKIAGDLKKLATQLLVLLDELDPEFDEPVHVSAKDDGWFSRSSKQPRLSTNQTRILKAQEWVRMSDEIINGLESDYPKITPI